MELEKEPARTTEPAVPRSPNILGWVGVLVAALILLCSLIAWIEGDILEAALADIFALMIGTLGALVLYNHRSRS